MNSRYFFSSFAATLSACIFMLAGCTAIPKAPITGGKQIAVGDGTEDMVLDETGPQGPRLLVSCTDRRHGESPTFGGIVAYNIGTETIDTLELREAPKGFAFRPHGMDLRTVGGRKMLYVVCHGAGDTTHWVACLQVEEDAVYWIRNFESPLLVSPNAVTLLDDGSAYVTNDHRKRHSLMESLFKQKVARIIHFDKEGNAKVAYDGLAYGNGITTRGEFVYAAATTGNAVFRLKMQPDHTLGDLTRIAKVKGPDNLRWDGDRLTVACHLRFLKFMGHAKNAGKHSPTVVYALDPEGQAKPQAIFADKTGKSASAGATGLIWKNQLYIGQVFGNWILSCPVGAAGK